MDGRRLTGQSERSAQGALTKLGSLRHGRPLLLSLRLDGPLPGYALVWKEISQGVCLLDDQRPSGSTLGGSALPLGPLPSNVLGGNALPLGPLLSSSLGGSSLLLSPLGGDALPLQSLGNGDARPLSSFGSSALPLSALGCSTLPLCPRLGGPFPGFTLVWKEMGQGIRLLHSSRLIRRGGIRGGGIRGGGPCRGS